MKIELRDLIAVFSVLTAFVSMLVVSRNARRATSVQTQNTDLTRIRDLRSELGQATDELARVRSQLGDLSRQLAAANDAAIEAMMQREEMLRFAHMPGMDIETWRRRFSPPGELSS